jgi:hypothetical protein
VVALFEDHATVADAPRAIVLGETEMLTVGTGVYTETVADWLAEPPAPVQLSVYVVLALRAPVDWLPFVALTPDQPPEAVHAVAFLVDHERVALEPLVTVLGLAASVIVGAGADTDTVADCAAVPPAPVQVSV